MGIFPSEIVYFFFFFHPQIIIGNVSHRGRPFCFFFILLFFFFKKVFREESHLLRGRYIKAVKGFLSLNPESGQFLQVSSGSWVSHWYKIETPSFSNTENKLLIIFLTEITISTEIGKIWNLEKQSFSQLQEIIQSFSNLFHPLSSTNNLKSNTSPRSPTPPEGKIGWQTLIKFR